MYSSGRSTAALSYKSSRASIYPGEATDWITVLDRRSVHGSCYLLWRSLVQCLVFLFSSEHRMTITGEEPIRRRSAQGCSSFASGVSLGLLCIRSSFSLLSVMWPILRRYSTCLLQVDVPTGMPKEPQYTFSPQPTARFAIENREGMGTTQVL